MAAPSAPAESELPTILDIEASGFGRGSYPIEIGFVLPDGRGWCTLVRPEPDWRHWDDGAQALHRIPRDLAQRHGRSAADVAHQLNDRLHGQTAYCDGWAHDYAWLARLYDAAELVPSFRLEHLMRLLDDDERARFDAVKRELAADVSPARHRASSDARLLQRALQRLGPRRHG